MGGEAKKRGAADMEVSGVWRGVGIPKGTTTFLLAGAGTDEVTGMCGVLMVRRVGWELSSGGTVVRISSTRDGAGTDDEGASGEAVASSPRAGGVKVEPSETWLVSLQSGYENGCLRKLPQLPVVAVNCVGAEWVSCEWRV